MVVDRLCENPVQRQWVQGQQTLEVGPAEHGHGRIAQRRDVGCTRLLQYQTGNIAANFINKNKLPKQKVFIYGDVVDARNSLYFYGDYFYQKITDANQLTAGSYVLASQKDYAELMKKKPAKIVFAGEGFNVTKLTFKFINPATRAGELLPFVIAEVK